MDTEMDKKLEEYVNKKFKLIFNKIFDFLPDIGNIKILVDKNHDSVTINTNFYQNIFSTSILKKTFKYRTKKILKKMNPNSLTNLTLNKSKRNKKVFENNKANEKLSTGGKSNTKCDSSVASVPTSTSTANTNKKIKKNIKDKKTIEKKMENKEKKKKKNKNTTTKKPYKTINPDPDTCCTNCKEWKRKYLDLEKKVNSCYLCLLKDHFDLKDYYLTAYNIYDNNGKKIYYNIEMVNGVENCTEYSSDDNTE